ncbi:LPS export ABC transporter periplasmic protein LptC [Rhizobiaceae bacterium]|nr:LPS export ABC transporter periplasmic protein LptC [Rhizobiaceae bacterium]
MPLRDDDPRGANRRTDRDFARARHHSVFVSFARFGLPVIAALSIAGFVGLAALSYTPLGDVDVASIGLSDGKLVMEEPKLAGFDSDNRPYTVWANEAVQDLTVPDRIELDTIIAKLPFGAGKQANLDAGSGTYDTKAETMRLRGVIRITGDDGLDIRLEDAFIDMSTGAMTSKKPVSVATDDATVTANSISVYDSGKRIVFTDTVRMNIQNSPVVPGPAATSKDQ